MRSGKRVRISGLVLPYVMPIMQAARALAPTLIGQTTSLTYPAMPVMVKTPALATVVSPPAKGANGKWTTTPVERGLEAHFESTEGKLLDFALMGTATAQCGALTKELPAILVSPLRPLPHPLSPNFIGLSKQKDPHCGPFL
uniref:Rubredoxin binding domain-containing protein n=1 Tax=Polynucleobacter necessarius subsp. necessarius (strain STIR1) TaxID=452638 RepID=B1XU07_POLNS